MHNTGLRDPRRNWFISLAGTLVAWAFVAWGALEMREAGQDALGPGLKVGLALLPAIFGPFMIYNFWLGMKVFAAIRRGENEIGRWTVTAAELTEFSARNKALDALGGENLNVWTAPREPLPGGLEVIFVADGVLVGDTYFGLASTGMFKISDIRILSESPPIIAFRAVTTWANRFGIRTSVGTLRIPVSRAASAEAAKVLGHFERVDRREVIANPGFYRGRMRAGLIGAPFFLAVSAVGFALSSTGRFDINNDVSGALIIIGLVLSIAMLILALAAWLLGRAQRRKTRSP